MSRRILLADDSVTIQKVIELTFMDDDYEVRAVGNGDEALAMLTALQVDFVIADVHMPGASGYEVCRRSKQQRPEVPVLLLVGTFEPFDESQARACGADSYLKKPFDSQELLGRVHDLLGPASAEAATAVAAVGEHAGAARPDAAETHEGGRPAAHVAAGPDAAPAGSPAEAGAHAAAAAADGAQAAATGRTVSAQEPGAEDRAPAAAPSAESAGDELAAGAGAVEAAASWQEFELEAEPELMPEPWHATHAPLPPAPATPSFEPFEHAFALGDLDDHEAPAGHDTAAGLESAAAAPAAPSAPAAATGHQPFTLGEPLDDHSFLLDQEDDTAQARSSRQQRSTQAEPVSPYAGARLGSAVPPGEGAGPSPSPATAATPETGFAFAAAPTSIYSPATSISPAIAAAAASAASGAVADSTADAASASGAGAAAADSAAAATAGAAAGSSASAAGAAEEAPPTAAGAGHPAGPGEGNGRLVRHDAAAGEPPVAPSAATQALGADDVDRIARRVVELIGDRVVRDIAWEVIPDLAEVVIKDRLRELESQIE